MPFLRLRHLESDEERAFTVGGSSGSPVSDAGGQIVAVHASGLREAVGPGCAVAAKFVLPLLPADARAELGLR